MFDLVIFDCDGVLIDSELISARMLIAELALHEVDIDLDYVARHFLGRSYPIVLKQIRTEFGIDLPETFEAEYRARLLAAFAAELTECKGVRDVISRVGVPTCVATSSSPERVATSLKCVGLAGLFGERVFTASQVSAGKPAPDLFLFTAAQMGVAPERCLVIEDSLNGVRAGLAAGMTVCRYVGGSHLAGKVGPDPDDAHAHHRITDFDQFFATFPGLQRMEDCNAT